jgi:hypothetical protein
MADFNYQFPTGIGGTLDQPYMVLTSYESKNAIESVGQSSWSRQDVPPRKRVKYNPGKPLSSIALYIPPNSLRQTTEANWEGVESGALRAAGVSGIKGIFSGDVALTEKLGNIFSSVGITAMGKTAEQLDKQTGMLSAGAGIAVNNHMAMAYKGPGKFRTHEFAFNFFPKNQDEAIIVAKILNDFQNGMLPRMMGTSLKNSRKLSKPFFQSPRHWDIEFFLPDGEVNDFLFEIKKSVITSMVVNHDPNSTVSFHYDGSPVQTTFSLTFQEIELPISYDAGSDIEERKGLGRISNVRKERAKGNVTLNSGGQMGGSRRSGGGLKINGGGRRVSKWYDFMLPWGN